MASSRASIESRPRPSTKSAAWGSMSSGVTSSRASVSMISSFSSCSSPGVGKLEFLDEGLAQLAGKSAGGLREADPAAGPGVARDRVPHPDRDTDPIRGQIVPLLALGLDRRLAADQHGDQGGSAAQCQVGGPALEGAEPAAGRARALGKDQQRAALAKTPDALAHQRQG